MIKAIGIAISGLNAATQRLTASANNIVQSPPDNLAEDIVNMKLAETAFKANVATIRTAEEMSDELLRIFDEKV
jgi:flagellar hook protein FlgE